jgi:hypothetical protein
MDFCRTASLFFDAPGKARVDLDDSDPEFGPSDFFLTYGGILCLAFRILGYVIMVSTE